VLGAVSTVCLLAPDVAPGPLAGLRAVFYVGFGLVIVVALLLSPLLSLALAKALKPILRWLRPVEGALAADSLIQSPRRTSASVAALMLSLTLAIFRHGEGWLAGWALTIAGAGLVLLFERHVTRTLAADLDLHLKQLLAGIDVDTSLDTRRIIRLPGTIHGATGNLCEFVPMEHLGRFRPHRLYRARSAS